MKYTGWRQNDFIARGCSPAPLPPRPPPCPSSSRSARRTCERRSSEKVGTKWPFVPPYTFIEPTKDSSRGSIKVASEKDQRCQVGPKVGPASAFYRCTLTRMHKPTCIFWANLTTFVWVRDHERKLIRGRICGCLFPASARNVRPRNHCDQIFHSALIQHAPCRFRCPRREVTASVVVR